MDKKIILSVLIVALIGIVAATYQINPGQEILNPLASVNTEDTPVTEVLTAPEESQQKAQTDANTQAKQQAQAEAQAQQAKDEAKAQQQAQQQSENTQPDSSAAGATSQSSVVNSENPVTIPSSATNSESASSSSDSGSSSSSDNAGNSGSSSSDSGSASSVSTSTSDSSSANSGSSTNGSSSTGANSNTEGSSSTGADSSTNGSSSTGTDSNANGSSSSSGNDSPEGDEVVTDSSVDDNTWSEVNSVVQGARSNFAFGIYADRESCSVDENGLYSVKVYNSDNNALVGTLFININKNSDEYGQWYLIDVNGDYQGKDVDPSRVN